MTVFKSLLDAVGDTPLIWLNRITAGLAAEVWVEVEFNNPGGSVKDRRRYRWCGRPNGSVTCGRAA